MKDHGLLFKDEMCRAIGREVDPKTQTRRLVARHNSTVDGARWSKESWARLDFAHAVIRNDGSLLVPNPKLDTFHKVRPIYEKGDRIWVKQVWAWSGDDRIPTDRRVSVGDVWYREDPEWDNPAIRWRSSLLMPKWATRHWLELVERVRAEKACDISREDAVAEGVYKHESGGPPYNVAWSNKPPSDPDLCAGDLCTPQEAFRRLWVDINDFKSLTAWSWRIPFSRLDVGEVAA